MADDEPRAGELTTANYGWTKPNVGNSDDAWGGMINADLDGIDSTVKSVSTVANAAYPASNPSGYQTATQVTAAVPVASSTTPLMDGTAAVGTGTTWARADHKHPSDTAKYDTSNPAGYITAAAIPAPYILPPASTTILGGVKTDGTTIKAATDGTISTTVVPLGDNRIINGDMRIDQRNAGASGTAIGYTVDRWNFNANLATKGAWSRASNGPSGFGYSLGFLSNSAYTPAAADYFAFSQAIEADMVTDFAWGTPQAQPVTLSFWVLSSLTGTFGGAISNYAGTRAYPFSYSIPGVSTWTKIVITIPGDTGGTWVMSGNGGSMSVLFNFGGGATYRGPAGAWASANYNGATGSVNVVATNGANFYVTGVKLEIGSVATPFNRYSLAKSMADCQRYYQAGTFTQGGYGGGSGSQYMQVFQVGMRAAPTVTPQFNTQTNCGSSAINLISVFSFAPYTVVGAVGGFLLTGNFTASAEL